MDWLVRIGGIKIKSIRIFTKVYRYSAKLNGLPEAHANLKQSSTMAASIKDK